jgi:molybdenum cofactor guanylyltransferase
MPEIEQHILDDITPVVLVGGHSLRFGRNKLLEPVRGRVLVSIPVDALRLVFGPRIAAVGACEPGVAAIADAVLEDPYPGLGPVGGICTALEATRGAVFVCAGDLVAIDAETIRTVLVAATKNPDALACLAHDGRVHPTIGLHRRGCLPHFEQAIRDNTLRLRSILPEGSVVHAAVPQSATRNINRPEDLSDCDSQ